MGRKKKAEQTGAKYVTYKCEILKQMKIPLPSESELKRLGNCSKVAIDNYFRSLMCPKTK